MKIIKNGVIPDKGETKRFVCSKCGCVFEANKGEYEKFLYWGQVLWSGFTCKCPTCGEYVREEKDAEWVDNKCSVCGKGIENLIESREWYENKKPNYCPFCGTRFIMKGSDAE